MCCIFCARWRCRTADGRYRMAAVYGCRCFFCSRLFCATAPLPTSGCFIWPEVVVNGVCRLLSLVWAGATVGPLAGNSGGAAPAGAAPAASGSNLLIRRAVFADIGGFDLSLTVNEDAVLHRRKLPGGRSGGGIGWRLCPIWWCMRGIIGGW